jgi:uncharacterized protein YuzE
MRASYDSEADAGSIWFVDSGASVDSGSVLDNLVFDYDSDDRIIGIEILNASLHLAGEALGGFAETEGDRMESMMLSVRHAADIDSLEVRFTRAAPTKDEEVTPGVTLAHDAAGRIVAIELKPASKLVSPRALEALA